jgi:hypothetical protein
MGKCVREMAADLIGSGCLLPADSTSRPPLLLEWQSTGVS